MNKAQKEVQQKHLEKEKEVIRLLRQIYRQAAQDCEERIRQLSTRTDFENLQSIIYQRTYQEALRDQLYAILNDMQTNEYTTIDAYLQECYRNGYIGTMYDIAQQGIPITMPINQEQVVEAVQTDSQLSEGLYNRLGEDVQQLRRSIRSELSRGIANGSSWNEMARQIAEGMQSQYNTAYNRAIVIARTEGHRVQQQSALNAQREAQKQGANIVKQWDATLDGRTRAEHRAADGQIRELDEPFEVGGEKLDAPGIGGSAWNVCNCRCCVLQRARWALDEDELQTMKDRAEYFGLDKTESFEEFKQNYLKLSEDADIIASGAISGARNPYGEKADEHANRYYGLVRSMKTDVKRIAKASGFSEKEIQNIKDYIFNDRHDLGGEEPERFQPDYMMAESWRRLIAGTPEAHDLTMLYHEQMERELVNQGHSQDDAHIITSKKYNYAKEAAGFYAQIEKYKKE